MISELMSDEVRHSWAITLTVVVVVVFVLATITLIAFIVSREEFRRTRQDKSEYRSWVITTSSIIAVSLVLGGIAFSPLARGEGVKFKDARAFVEEQTGQSLDSRALFLPPGDLGGENLQDLHEIYYWTVTVGNDTWDLKAHRNGKLGFYNGESKTWLPMKALKVVKLGEVKKKIEKTTALSDVTMKNQTKDDIAQYQLESPSEKRLSATGEYKGQLVEAYVGMDERGGIRLVPVNKAGGVTEDDLVQK